MKTKTIAVIFMFLCLGLSGNVFAENQGKGNGKHFVLNVVGVSLPSYEATVPDPDNVGGLIDALCYDVDLVNMNTRQLIGTATDCLSDPTPTGGGVALIGTTFFNLPSGTLITQGKTTVQAAVTPIVTPDGQLITHITGASGTGNAILEGTGRFTNATGTARLSGMVNLMNFSYTAGDSIAFDCLFIIDLD
jgi:hypothetical protein